MQPNINDCMFVSRQELEEVIKQFGNHIGTLMVEVEKAQNQNERPIHVTCKCDCCCNKPAPEPVDPCPPVDKDRIGSQGRSKRNG